MPRISDWLGSVLAELRRRNVLQVGAGYAVAAWVAFQVAAVVLRDALFLPPWVLTLVVVVGILGFPVALFLAWRYDLTSEGLERAEPWDAEDAPDEPARHRVAVALTLVALIATVGAGWTALRAWTAARDGAGIRVADESHAPALAPTRIAVLPFDDHSAEGDLSGVAAGLTGDLIRELDRVAGLELVSYTGVQPFHDPRITLDSVARILGAGTLVEGSVTPAGDSLVLSVNLVDGVTDTRMGSVQLAEARDSVLALRSALVEEVARELRRTLGTELELRSLRSGTEDDRAWELFHRARDTRLLADTLSLAGDTASARGLLLHADSLLAVADSLSEDWNAPIVERARIALYRAQLGLRSVTDLDTALLARGHELVEEALATEREDPDAMGLRGTIRYRASQVPGFDPGWASQDSAEADLRRTVDLDPKQSRAWAELSRLLQDRGHYGEARMAARRSRSADPFLGHDVHYLYSSASLALQLEDFETAGRLVRRGRRLFPEEPAYEVLQLTLLAGPRGPEPDPDTAWSLLHALEERIGAPWPEARLLVAGVLARQGLADSATAVLARAKEAAPDHPFTLYNAANVHLQLGEPDSALALLRSYIDTLPGERGRVAQDWWFDALQDDPGFRDLVARSDGDSDGAPGR